MAKKKTVSRSAVNGEFVSKEEAKVKPDTTVTETNEPHVVHHVDRRDSGTNWLESDKLPNLPDPSKQ